jgi:hypothetical protein
MNKLRAQLLKEAEAKAEEYSDGCDNESGSFLSRDLKAIRKKAAKTGHASTHEMIILLAEALEELAPELSMVHKIWHDERGWRKHCEIAYTALEKLRQSVEGE